MSHTESKQWWVYIACCADNSLYTGISNDLQRRIEQHNSKKGHGARYTRARQPVHLVYQEPASNRATASQREYAIKQLSRNEKVQLIESVKQSATTN